MKSDSKNDTAKEQPESEVTFELRDHLDNQKATCEKTLNDLQNRLNALGNEMRAVENDIRENIGVLKYVNHLSSLVK